MAIRSAPFIMVILVNLVLVVNCSLSVHVEVEAKPRVCISPDKEISISFRQINFSTDASVPLYWTL